MLSTKSETAKYDGYLLPAPELRSNWGDFSGDELFIRTARAEADRVIKAFDLNGDSSILDIGCGPGRLAIGLIDYVGEIREYRGVDVCSESVDWCRRNLSASHPNFQFIHIDVHNEGYNPDGELVSTKFRLPFQDNEFDVVYLSPVFSHMWPRPVSTYLREIRRVLKPKGYVFLTAFVEENVPSVEERPEDYSEDKFCAPLRCVQYEKGYFKSMISASGLRMVCFDHASEIWGQSGLYLMKPGETL